MYAIRSYYGLDTLKYELEAIPNVDVVSFSWQVPYEQNNSTRNVTLQPGDEAGKMSFHIIDITPDFFATYDIPILAGRGLSRDIGNDKSKEENETLNVITSYSIHYTKLYDVKRSGARFFRRRSVPSSRA